MEHHSDDVAWVVCEAGRRAAAAGAPAAVRLCRIRRGGLAISTARETLAACLESLPQPKSELLSLQQAAEYLGYSTKGLRKVVRRGELRFLQTKPRAPLKFRKEWLDDFGTRQVEPAKSQPVKSKHGFDPQLLG
jgi:excisionase family DNA binding protein